MDEKKPMLTNGDREKARNFLDKGRVDLSDAEPFVAYGSYRLDFIEKEGIPTLCTDGNYIYYSPRYVLDCRTDEIPAMYFAVSEVEHETWHGALGHCSRDWSKETDAEGDLYDPALTNTAQDHVINLMIKASGRLVHPAWVCDDRFAGMGWQDIYLVLKRERKSGKKVHLTGCVVLVQPAPDPKGKTGQPDQDEPQEPGPSPSPAPGKDPGDGKTPGAAPGKDPLPSTPHNDWDQIVVEAAEFSAAIGRLPGHLKQYADTIRKPDIDWRPIVARWMSRMKRGDFSYRRPNRRYLREGLVLPSPYSYTANLLVVADSSGSMWTVIRDLLSEVYWIGKALGVPFDLAFTDTEAYPPRRMKGPNDVARAEIQGDGGTDFTAFFDWLKKSGKRYDAVVFFTDGYASFPDRKPQTPVLWVVTHGGSKPPWGETVFLPKNHKRR